MGTYNLSQQTKTQSGDVQYNPTNENTKSLEANSDRQADRRKKPLIGARASALPKKFEVHLRGPVGSIEGPRRVVDLMRVHLCVPRVP